MPIGAPKFLIWLKIAGSCFGSEIQPAHIAAEVHEVDGASSTPRADGDFLEHYPPAFHLHRVYTTALIFVVVRLQLADYAILEQQERSCVCLTSGAELNSRIAPAVFAIAYAAAFEASHGLFLGPGQIGVFWPAAGLLLAMLTHVPVQRWIHFLIPASLVTFVADIGFHGYAAAPAAGYAAANVLQAIAGALLLKWSGISASNFHRPGQALRATAWVAAAVGFVGAPLGAAVAWAIDGQEFAGIWSTWFLGDLIGVLVGMPPTFAFLGRSNQPSRARQLPRWEPPLALASVWISAGAVFLFADPGTPVTYAALPALIWPALRLGPGSVAASLLLLAAIVVHGTRADLGPLAVPGMNALAELSLLQGFLLVAALQTLALSIVAGEWARLRGGLEAEVAARTRTLGEQNARLAEREALIRAVLSSTEELIYAKDLDGRYTILSRGAAALHGRSVEECLGKSDAELLPASVAAAIRTNDLAALQSGKASQFDEVGTIDGRECVFQSTKAPLVTETGQFIGIVGVSTNVTARRQAERETERARQAAEAASRAKTRFLAAASHDLRQPVQSLSLFLDVFANRAHRQDQDLISPMRQSLDSLSGLLNALLDISRLEAGQVTAQIQPIPMQPLLDRLAAEYGPRAAEKGLRFRAMRSSSWVYSDPVLLERVLRNLIENALKYTENGGVLLGCRRSGNTISLQVVDTGIGICASEQQLIWEEFHQIANPERDREKGLGLGLSIVRRLCSLLGHDVDLRSAEGHGSCFAVSMRRAAPVRLQSAPVASDVISAKRGRVLVVDDDVLVRQGYVAMLEAWGHEVVHAGSGQEAIQALNARGGWIPDAVLADYRLQDNETGADVVAQVRRHFGPVPAVIITGDTDPDRLKEADAAGAKLLHKPVRTDHLRHAIDALLPERGSQPYLSA